MPVVTAIALPKTETSRIPDLADVISETRRLRESVVETETMVSFRVYARQELEARLNLGLD